MQADGTICIPLVVRSLSCSPTSGSLDLHFNATISLTVRQHTKIFCMKWPQSDRILKKNSFVSMKRDTDDFQENWTLEYLITFQPFLKKKATCTRKATGGKAANIIQYHHWFKKRQVYEKVKKVHHWHSPPPLVAPAVFPEEKPPSAARILPPSQRSWNKMISFCCWRSICRSWLASLSRGSRFPLGKRSGENSCKPTNWA